MLLGSLAFAVMATFAHALADRCDWQLIAGARAFIACVMAWVLARAVNAPLVFWKPAVLWTRSIAGSISMVCFFFALERLPTSDVMTVSNMFPIWVALLCWPLYAEVPSLQVWSSVVMGVAGVYLIQQPRLAEGNFAMLFALAASVSTAVAMLGLHHLAYLDTRAVVVHFSAVATAFCGVSFLLLPRRHSLDNVLEGPTLLVLLGVGASATIGQLCLTKAFTTGPPAKVSVVGLTQIVFAIGFDAVLWHRSFDLLTLAGTVLIVVPTAWILLYGGRAPETRRKTALMLEEPVPERVG
jgi:drug/metabolite transporter (DMT)-like permease